MCAITRPEFVSVAGPVPSPRRGLISRSALVVLGCLWSATPALAQYFRTSAFASATETYTTNVDFFDSSVQGQSTGDFVTALSAGINVRWNSPNFRLGGSLGATWLIYAKDSSRNSFVVTPGADVNLSGTLELVKNHVFVDVGARLTPEFLSPFGPQPDSFVNSTENRSISQTYWVNPRVQGVIGSTGISYNVRIQNIWEVSSAYGNSSNNVPATYVSTLNASLTGARPCASTLEYDVTLYESGGRAGGTDSQTFRCVVPYQVTPQLEVSGRIGYDRYSQDETTDNAGRVLGGTSEGVVYGAGFQWNPTLRTRMAGFWEHRFFGSSYSWQFSHRMPNAAFRASFTRGLSSYPELALLIPANTTVSQFLNAAFTTRIPDPTEREKAVEEFLARTGLPPTLASPVNFYADTLLLQNAMTASLVLIGVRNTLTFTVFRVDSQNVSSSGAVLPPALQFGENNTQTGVRVNYARPLGWQTNLNAYAGYSRTVSNTTETATSDLQSDNVNAGVRLGRPLGPRTNTSFGLSYSRFDPSGRDTRAATSATNVYATISHTF